MMYEPPHPGEVLKEDVLPELGLTVSQAAAQLKMSREALSRVLNGKSAISASLAVKLEKWLGGPDEGPSAESWMTQQMNYVLWKEFEKGGHDVERAHAA